MSYIKFDKEQLVNLEYSLNRELLRTNRAGSYSSTTIIGCNTRKYHGLLTTAQPGVDKGLHILLSSLDETIIQHDAEFNLGIHMFKNEVFSPKGHKYIVDLEADPIPYIIYRVGGAVLKKERLFSTNQNRILVRYTLLDAHSPTILRLTPYLAFRNRHSVSLANSYADTRYFPIENGIKMRLYEGYSFLHMQFSKTPAYEHAPDWFYDFEYLKDKERGFDSREDLLVPGYFDLTIKKGESIVFAAGIEEISPSGLSRQFSNEIQRRTPRNSYLNCLSNSAQQFIFQEGRKIRIIAGYPWLGSWARDTFIALPGLTLTNNDYATFLNVVDTMIDEMDGAFFCNKGTGSEQFMPSVDASLWFFKALQHYVDASGEHISLWKKYNAVMRNILSQFRRGALFGIHMLDNGLLWAGDPDKPLTWMDAMVDGKPLTPRRGLTVEMNALWFDAIMFSLHLAQMSGDTEFIDEWSDIGKRLPDAFIHTFWNQQKGYLADYVDGDFVDWSVRPNQIIAAASPYNLLSEEIRMQVVDKVQRELLTPRGLRTLSPQNPAYHSSYKGDQGVRDLAYHQGTAWPWLLTPFADAYFQLYGKGGIHMLSDIYDKFEDVMQEHGLGSISQLYSGDPPYEAGGTISQATSVASMLYIENLIRKYI